MIQRSVKVKTCGACPFMGRHGHGEPPFCLHPKAEPYLVCELQQIRVEGQPEPPAPQRPVKCPLPEHPVRTVVEAA